MTGESQTFEIGVYTDMKVKTKCSLVPGEPLSLLALLLLVLMMGARPLASQTQTEQQFIASVQNSIQNLVPTGIKPAQRIVFSGNLVFANGKAMSRNNNIQTLLAYVDGLKAAGAQRVDLNPGVTTVTNSATMQIYDAVIRHIRELGMQVALNPEYTPGELGKGITFADFQKAAEESYVAMATRYQPENFVIVHEPTTAAASMGIATSIQDWHNFILDLEPRIKAASPRTRVGAGGFQNGVLPQLSQQENNYWQDFVLIPACSAGTITTGCLDFMTMDIYNDDTFPTYNNWIQLAKTNNKGIYIAETWAPHYLPNPLPSTALSSNGNLKTSLDALALVGAASPDFKDLDTAWLQAMATWASMNGLEAITAFTTEAFFAYGSAGSDHISSPGYSTMVQGALGSGMLTSTGQAFRTDVQQMGLNEISSVSSASYARLSSNFCGPNACNGNATVTADELVSGFGTGLATGTSPLDGTFPTTLEGTTITLVDSSNTSFQVPMFFASPGQVNYYIPPNVKPGPAAITVKSADGTTASGTLLIATVMPGIYTANSSGQGAPAAVAVCSGVCAGWPNKQGSQYFQTTFTGCPNCQPQPISVAPGDTVVVELFATGVRHLAALSAITATINNQTVPVLFAGATGYKGEDQINVQIPSSLAGSGNVNLVLTVQDTADGSTVTSNAVALDIR